MVHLRNDNGNRLHHIASFTPEFENAIDTAAKNGGERVFDDATGSSRLAMVDARSRIHSLYEVIELGPTFRQ